MTSPLENSEKSTGSEFVHLQEEAVLSGYLYKKTRDGRWQRRWFETNGSYLTYYKVYIFPFEFTFNYDLKSRKMEKLLAALSLPQVGEIKLIPQSDDPEKKEGLFALELNTRVYTLRAKNEAEAITWVNTLTHIRQQGITSSTENKNPLVKPFASEGTTLAPADSNGSNWEKQSRCFGCC